MITLGGDGTLMFAAQQFVDTAPPILPFELGTPGFLTPFKEEHLLPALDSVLHGTSQVTLRMRLRCEIVRRQPGGGGGRGSPSGSPARRASLAGPPGEFVVLNELVRDRASGRLGLAFRRQT